MIGKKPQHITRVREQFPLFQTFVEFVEKKAKESYSWKRLKCSETWENNCYLKKQDEKIDIATINDFLSHEQHVHISWLLNYDVLEKKIIKLLSTDKTKTICALVQKRSRLRNLIKVSKSKICNTIDHLGYWVPLLQDSQPLGYVPDVVLSLKYNFVRYPSYLVVGQIKNWIQYL